MLLTEANKPEDHRAGKLACNTLNEIEFRPLLCLLHQLVHSLLGIGSNLFNYFLVEGLDMQFAQTGVNWRVSRHDPFRHDID